MTAATARHSFALRLAAGIAGYCAFINLYSPQSLLPLLSQEFGASAAEVSTIISVSTLAVALTAPVARAVGNGLSRKRGFIVGGFVLVFPAVMVAMSSSMQSLNCRLDVE